MAAANARENVVDSDGWGRGSRIIDTGFTTNVGETVVVGTSRLQGERR